MAEKTYVSRKPGLSLSFPHAGTLPNTIKDESIAFVGGLFTTDDPEDQKWLEGHDLFKSGAIWLQTPALELSAAKATAGALRAVADKAEAAAAAAEGTVAELQKGAAAA